jgi:hypothetical protein
METKSLKLYVDIIKQDGDNVWVRPICDFFRIDVRNQHKNIKNDAILKKMVEKNTPSLGEIDDYGRIKLTKKGFSRWIQIINPNIVPVELREMFIDFQANLEDYLYGSEELRQEIRTARNELEAWSRRYSEAGLMVQRKRKILEELYDNMFQQKLPFEDTKQLTFNPTLSLAENYQ